MLKVGLLSTVVYERSNRSNEIQTVNIPISITPIRCAFVILLSHNK